MRKYILSLTFLFILTPVLAFGQFTGYTDPTITEDKSVISFTNDASINANLGNGKCNLTEKTLKGYVNYLGCAAQVFVIPFIFTIAVVAFVFGVVMMISTPKTKATTAIVKINGITIAVVAFVFGEKNKS